MALQPSPGRNRNLARSTVIVVVAFALAKAISLAQTFLIAGVFGLSAEYDAFVTANRIPEQIYNLIAGGALAFAFIPVFTGLLAKDDEATAWRTASHIVNTIFTVTLIVSVLAFIFAPWLIDTVVAPGFPPETQAQTVELMRILLISTLIFSVSGIAMGVLQSFNLFLPFALAPILYDVGILFGVIVLIPVMGVHGIAVGAVIGAALHFGVQIPGLVKARARWQPGLGLNDPHLRQIIKLMIPRVADLGVIAISTIVTSNLLSRLGEGATSAFDWGWRLMQIPETLIGTAMGVVIFPTLAALSAVGDLSGKRDAMSGALRFILIGTIPSAVGLILIGRPMISLLERGAFDASASDQVYNVLQFFAFGIIVQSLLEVLARSFYADKDTTSPLLTAIGGFVVTFISAILFSNIAAVEQQGPSAGNVGGLALANTLGITFEVVVLGALLRRRWRGLNENRLMQTTLKTLAASIVMALAIGAIDAGFRALGFADGGLVITAVQLGVEVVAGTVVFVGVALFLKLDELRTLIGMVVRRGRPAVEAAG